MSTMGQRIKKSREAKNLLQGQLANMIGVKSAGVISNWEKDVSKPDANKIVRLCKALNISASYLLDYHGENLDECFTEDERNHIKKYRSLDDYGKDAVNSVLDAECRRISAASVLKSDIILSSEDDDEEDELPTYTVLYGIAAAAEGSGAYLENFDDQITIIANDETRQADLVIKVEGRSMEPDYFDGEYVLVRLQPEIDIGEVGIWIIDNLGYIKERGCDRLISRNPDVPDVIIGEGDCRCIGKVIGELDPEMILEF